MVDSIPLENKTSGSFPILVSIIVPFFNEQEALQICHQRILKVLNELNAPCEIIYVDDGSKDASWTILNQQISQYKALSNAANYQVKLLQLSRNFGKEAAMSAGLKQVRGKAAIILDADLQDPPELIVQMLSKWQEGFDVVDMRRISRPGESWLKRYSAKLYYRLINHLSDIPIPENVGDFRLLDHKVVAHINQLSERTRYMKGLFAWPGFKRTQIDYQRDSRVAGRSKWPYSKLLNLAFDGITSFSTKPLRLATIIGSIASFAALFMLFVVVFKTLVFGEAVAGYPSLISVILFLGGVQLLSIGLLGEYVGRLFIEAKQRPLFIVKQAYDYQAQSEPLLAEVS